MPSNQAAWITAAKTKPLEVKSAPYPEPGEDEIIIKAKAVAINPVDWKIQDTGMFLNTYPFVLGCDVAGEVVAVGSQVTAFRTGQRVMANTISLQTNNPAHGAFQNFVAASTGLAAHIPASMGYETAAVLPLAISTASAALFQPDHLALPHPDVNAPAQSTGSAVLIWGGSSSVGSLAIQLAKAAGAEVLTTASAHNHEYVRALGANHVFDHSSATVVDDICRALKGRTSAGVFDTISLPETIKKCAEIADRAGGRRHVSTTLPPPEGLPKGVSVAGVFALTIRHNEVGPAVWANYVPKALETGQLKAVPEPLVIGSGLEKVQEGMDKNKAGVSARKVVIAL